MHSLPEFIGATHESFHLMFSKAWVESRTAIIYRSNGQSGPIIPARQVSPVSRMPIKIAYQTVKAESLPKSSDSFISNRPEPRMRVEKINREIIFWSSSILCLKLLAYYSQDLKTLVETPELESYGQSLYMQPHSCPDTFRLASLGSLDREYLKPGSRETLRRERFHN